MSFYKTTFAVVLMVGASFIGAATAEEAKSLPLINGEVTKVDESAGKMTIKHEAITNLEMGAMTMVLKASDSYMLTAVKPGDKINGQITATKVEKAK